MGDSVFINGRAAVHKGSNGKAIGFPDVCLCPPTPPAGPVPTPLPNTVVAQDLTNGARSVLIEGNPAGHAKSYFAKSTGNEVSRPTGGGVVTHGVQGTAHFASHSQNVFIEGKPAVRHLDLLTHNHMGAPAGNTPPSTWLSTMSMPPVAPAQVQREANEKGTDWIDVEIVDEHGKPISALPVQLELPSGKKVSGRTPRAARVGVQGFDPGTCKLKVTKER